MRKAKTHTVVCIAVIAVFAFAEADRFGAQNQENRTNPPHYKLVDLGTLGGPQGYLVPGSGEDSGTVVGFADTSSPDPFPNFCFWDCKVVHAFAARENGELADLGALSEGSSLPMWVSSNGLIAGVSENGETDPLYPGLPQTRAVLWRDGTITDLGTLPGGGYQSEANAVNSSGQVVGAALNTIADPSSMEIPSPIGPAPFWLGGGITPPYLYQMRAFIWDEEHGMQDLETLPGGSDAQAILINEPGQVVGYSYTASTHTGACFPLATDSFIWEKGKGMTDLGGFGGTCTLATALNNRGQVVGESYRTGDQSAPGFLWEKGSIQELEGSFGGDFSGAFAINEQGEAAGFATLPGNATFHAALWTSVKSIADLGVIGSDLCSYAAAINEHAQVVGSSLATCDSDAGPVRAILWEGGSLFDLNALIPADSSLHLQFTQAINDRGEIAGSGADANGNQHAFLLIPCDDGHPNIEGCDYSPLDAAAVEMSTRSDSLRESASTPNSSATKGELAPEVQSALGSERNSLNRLFRRRLAFARTLATPRVATLTSTALTLGPNATLSPMNLIFSTRAIGTTSSGQKITLSNMGTTTLNITSIAITGTNAGDFSQTHTCGSSLASTANCTISVTFRPGASGTRTAAVSVTDNASGSPQKVALSGTGTAAKLSPTSLSFSTRPIGTTSPGKSVTLTNVGTTSFNITAIAITGRNAADYSQTHTCGTSLGPSASCTITLTFKPTASGTRTAALSVSDSAAGSPQTVPITGSGTAAKLSPTSLNLGSVVVGNTSGAQTVSLTNVGTTTFDITAIAITGSDPGDFSQTYTCGTSLAPTASCTIIVTFKPTTTGTRTAAISVSDTAVGSPQTVSLTGSGTTARGTLTGSCVHSLLDAFRCGATSDPTQCPTGEPVINPETVLCGAFGSFYIDEARSCRVAVGGGQFRPGSCQYRPSTFASVPNSSGLGPSAAAKTCDAATSIRAAVKHGVSAAYGEQLNSRSTGGDLKTHIKRLIAILAVAVELGFWPGL